MLAEQKKYLYPHYLLQNSIAAIIYFLIGIVFGQPKIFAVEVQVWILCYLLPVLVLLAAFSKKLWYLSVFNRSTKRPAWITVLILICGFSISFLVVSVNYFISGSTEDLYSYFPISIRYNILLISLGYIYSAVMLVVSRRHLIRIIQKADVENNLIKAVLIAGTGLVARTVAHAIDTNPLWGIRIVGHLASDQSDVGKRIGDHDILGTMDMLASILLDQVVDMVLISDTPAEGPLLDAIIQRCRLEGVDIAFATSGESHHPEKLPEIDACFQIHEKVNGWVLNIFKFVYQQPKLLFLKRILDLSLSVAIICVSLPVFVTVSILIRLESQGPILYHEERIGKRGRRFHMYKFRTMIADSDKKHPEVRHLNDRVGPDFKMKNVLRLTHVGRILRKTGLDELPKLFNVVRGNMSLVGPYPPIYDEACQYRLWEKKRLSVMQGITGFWQVSGRNEYKFDECIKLDLLYIKEWRFILDLIILLKTPLAVLAGKRMSKPLFYRGYIE